MTAVISQTIRTRFNDQWPTLQPTVPHYFAGQEVPFRELAERAWVRLTILPGNVAQAAIGGATGSGRVKRTTGIAVVSIFVPIAEGDGLAQELADSVASVWEMSTLSGVIFRATTPQRIAEEGAWLQYNATTPYQGDTLVT
jgi:hypothetical protein